MGRWSTVSRGRDTRMAANFLGKAMINTDIRQTRTPIVIVGFMGSGKTTVARELARLLNCGWADLDQLICERETRSPGEIIEQSGEDEFRRIETDALREVMNEGSARIIAPGGGAWSLRRNRDLIEKHQAFTIWLDAPFDVCWKRIQASGEKRPLARDERQAQKLYADRRPEYALAKMQMQVGANQRADEICRDIFEALPDHNK